MVDIEGAVQYIQQHGTPLQQSLAGYAVGAAAAGDVLAALTPYQRDDGGWTGLDPDCPTALSVVSCTWLALQYLRWISADGHPLVDSTADFLTAQQHAEGYWDEADAITQHNPPPWMQPGDRKTRVWLTAAVARMLMETGHETQVYFGRALTYLSQAWEDGVFQGKHTFLHPLWMMLPLFHIRGQPEDKPIVEGCHTRLLAAVSFGELDPMDVTAVAHAALNTRYAGNQLYIAARDRVLAYQQADGGWATDYGAAHRPNATVDALMLLRWGGLL